MLGHKTSLHKVKLLKSNQVSFLITNGMKMEINNLENWKFHKYVEIKKTLLKDLWAR